MKVWILSLGEICEGGSVIGVFADRDLARGQFVTEAQKIHDRFAVRDLNEDENGAIYLEGGCDWLSLEPHSVVTAAELTA